MHELPVTQSLLDIALQHAQAAGAERIVSLDLVIGQYASLVDDSIQFYWDMIAEGTLAEGAQLVFHRLPATFECQACHAQYVPLEDDFACPTCGSEQVTLVSGREFYLESIDVT
jgi:hydrogenase nickel incorporation protein HypA/HybF